MPQVCLDSSALSLSSSTMFAEIPQWFAAYTCAHHEKRVAEQLRGRGIECFLPLYSTIHRWKDRKVTLELPLFPGYIFVYLAAQKHFRVLEVPGVARIVGTSRRPTPLPDREIQVLMDAKALAVRTEPYRFLTAGAKVRVKAGHFEGLEGFVLRRKGMQGMVVTLRAISSAFVLEVDAADLERAPLSKWAPAQLRTAMILHPVSC
jgi:transcription antitermination factor NusG